MKNKGFTLIELLVVIVVLTLISAVILPNLGGSLSKRKFKRHINSFIGLISHVRNQSALFRKGFYLNIDINENEYWITQIQKEEPETETKDKEKKDTKEQTSISPFLKTRKKLDKSIEFVSVVFPGTEKIDKGEANIKFLPTGFVDQSIIYLRNSDDTDMVYSLIIKPLSGRVQLVDGYAE